jgi:hypothetical protein
MSLRDWNMATCLYADGDAQTAMAQLMMLEEFIFGSVSLGG